MGIVTRILIVPTWNFYTKKSNMINKFVILYNYATAPTAVTDATGNVMTFVSGTAAKDYVRLHSLPSVIISRVEIVM